MAFTGTVGIGETGSGAHPCHGHSFNRCWESRQRLSLWPQRISTDETEKRVDLGEIWKVGQKRIKFSKVGTVLCLATWSMSGAWTHRLSSFPSPIMEMQERTDGIAETGEFIAEKWGMTATFVSPLL